MRIGLLGGSFDPVHLAHIELAHCALRDLDLAQLQLIPAKNPWQKGPLGASTQQRLEMLELACHDADPKVHINTIEIERDGPTYTLDTLKALPLGPSYFWILGADQLNNFCTWNGWEEIIERVDLALAQRPKSVATPPIELSSALEKVGRPLHHINMAPQSISSTDIRHRLATGQSTEGLLDISVARYIDNHRLYQPEHDRSKAESFT